MYVCMYACMFFGIFSRQRALTEPKVVPYGRVLDNTLLRHVFSAVVFPTRAWHVIVVPEAVFRIVGHQAAWVRAANEQSFSRSRELLFNTLLDTDTFQSISRFCSHASVCIMSCMQSLVGNSLGKNTGLLEQRYTVSIIKNFNCLKQNQTTTDRAFIENYMLNQTNLATKLLIPFSR